MSEKNEPLMGTPTAKRGGWRKTLERYVPILEWLPNYPWSESLMPDIAGSMTLGFVLIGQSLAHAHLCKVELINGPYSCMLPPIIYAFFGTSVHASVGTGVALSGPKKVLNCQGSSGVELVDEAHTAAAGTAT
ncbi:unnamed protein product [Polarella glacialis]|uniref:SLC26A/SulP transporter domain-containing protein n=1 Tax=Polarella glacialis TaxID=89957 RepID=A0A813GLD7_POLGL|nr:unnamed protein product [Polarella glacialis]